jgi:hypothetical protein
MTVGLGLALLMLLLMVGLRAYLTVKLGLPF